MRHTGATDEGVTLLDPRELYQLTAAEGTLSDMGRPALIQAMAGFVDAGSATKIAYRHLLDNLDAQTVATFHADELIDYRSRRPVMEFVENRWASYEEPRLELHLLRDRQGTPFLLLGGPEPDLRWEAFARAVTMLIETLEVQVTIGLNAIPMAVPHTRPIGVTAHATRPELIGGYEPWLQRVRVPAGAGQLLEYRLGQQGRDAIGFAAHVPHYLAQSEYPAAAETLLTQISRGTGLLLPTDELRTAAEVTRADVDRQVGESEEATALVQALEQQYDALLRERKNSIELPVDDAALPTAEELGAELERFLAEQANGDGPNNGPGTGGGPVA